MRTAFHPEIVMSDIFLKDQSLQIPLTSALILHSSKQIASSDIFVNSHIPQISLTPL